MEDEFNNKRILVTGGAGFVGSNLVNKLIEIAPNVSVTVLDDLFTGELKHINSIERVNFVKGSVSDRTLVKKLIKQNDIVFHLAARNIIVSTKDPFEDLNTNVFGTYNILEAAKEYNVERIIYTSSASVYGNSRYLPINEDDSLNILNPYAASKLSGENYCMAFYETYGLPVTILRYSNVFGYNQSPKNPYCGVVSKFFASIMAEMPPQIHGDGEQTRDFTFVDDAVEATILAAISPKAEGEVFNVGTGKETSVKQLAKTIIAICGKTFSPEHIDRRDIDNLRRRVLNIEKIRKFLRWSPNTSLEKALIKTYVWLVENQYSWDKMKMQNLNIRKKEKPPENLNLNIGK